MKEINLSIFENIQGVEINAHKNHPAGSVMCSTQLFISTVIKNSSPDTQLVRKGKLHHF